jgi:stage II sporulation protein E
MFGELSPFAAGICASAYGAPPGSTSVAGLGASPSTGLGGAATLVGAILGTFVFAPFTSALKYTAICFLIAAAGTISRNTPLGKTMWFMPSFAAVAGLSVALVTYSASGFTLQELVFAVLDGTLVGGSAFFFRTALSPWTGTFSFERGESAVHTSSVLVLISTILMSLSGVTIFGVFSVGRAVGALVVFFAAYYGGVNIGCATGVVLGLALDCASGAPPLFVAAFGLAGLVAGLFSKRSRFVFALIFIITNASVAVMGIVNPVVPSILYEVFVASVLFMITPTELAARLGAAMPERAHGAGMVRAREYTRRRVEQASLAFRELYSSVTSMLQTPVNTENTSAVFARAANRFCRNCTRGADCWQSDYQDTVDAMNNATAPMLARGSLDISDLPERFTDSCRDADGFVAAVNAELRALLYRRGLETRLRENRSVAYHQYAEFSEILGDISSELGSSLGLEPELESKLRRYLRGLGIAADVAVFRARGGRLHVDIYGADLAPLRREKDWLDRLSAAVGARLCMPDALAGGRLELLEAEPFAAEIGYARLNKAGKTVSGDQGAFFKTEDGLLYVLLSDGMGSGEAARQASGETIKILERFLRAGVAPEAAVRMLGDIMLLKNEDETVSATVDLACLNLFTGELELYKYGAAPSYVKSGGNVREIRGQSVSPGLLPSSAPDILQTQLNPGMYAIVVSDGVTSGMDVGELTRLISVFDGNKSERAKGGMPADETSDAPSDLSRAIVDAVRARGATDDDVTAIVIKVEERG